MTIYEMLRSVFEPFTPALYGRVRRDIGTLLRTSANDGHSPRPRLLDVGGRKSPYTLGLPAFVTVLDVARENDIQEQLGLGINAEILLHLRKKRSNIEAVILEDITKCTLGPGSYDGALCIEVIEHIVDDALFISQVARTIRRGGFLYLTTPNGDYVKNEFPNYNPDHVRHYTRESLEKLLGNEFEKVQVAWGIKTGKNRFLGLRSLDYRRPLRSISSMGHNFLSHLESQNLALCPQRRAHLIATATKP